MKKPKPDLHQLSLPFDAVAVSAPNKPMPVNALVVEMDALDDFNFMCKIKDHIKRDGAGNIAASDSIYLKIGNDDPQPLRSYICDLTNEAGAKDFWNSYTSGNLLDDQGQLTSPRIFLVTPSGEKVSRENSDDVCDTVKITADIGSKIIKPFLTHPNASVGDVNLTKCLYMVFADKVEISGLNGREIEVKLPKGSVNYSVAPISNPQERPTPFSRRM